MFERIREDIEAAFERDPAARSKWEVLLAYPGLHALWLHRLAHGLWQRRHPLLARVVSQVSRALTGVEIHPGARIGKRVFIDHGMGVVIGETAVVGDDVLMYQGVVLGGTSLEKVRRHPMLEDGVVLGAGAIVLGPITVGHDARVGAGSVVVKDVPPGATVVGVPARIAGRRDRSVEDALDHGELPDPMVRVLTRVFERESELGERLAELEKTVARLHDQAMPVVAQPADDELEEMVLERLRDVLDPEVGVSVVDMGFVRRVKALDSVVSIDMVLTSPACPFAGEIMDQVRRAARAVPGVQRVLVTLLDEPWSWEWFASHNGDDVKEKVRQKMAEDGQ